MNNVSLLVEIPEDLHQGFLRFLDSRPDWDQDRVMTAALSLFLLQNQPAGKSERQANARIYLDSLFKQPVEKL